MVGRFAQHDTDWGRKALPRYGGPRASGTRCFVEKAWCQVIDFHCHLDLYPDPHAVRDECARRGLYVLSVTTTPSAWNGTFALSRDAPRIRTALGLHPQLAYERHSELDLFESLIAETRYVGEIGLD